MLTSVKPMGGRVTEMCALAGRIWREHYPKYLGTGQVEYMLEKYQSPAAIKANVKDGYDWFFLQRSGRDVGYLAVHPEAERLFLSKIYVDAKERGKGVARDAMEFVVRYAKERKLKAVYLKVLQDNVNSVNSYIQMGFRVADRIVTDFGGGYVVDDFVMERKV